MPPSSSATPTGALTPNPEQNSQVLPTIARGRISRKPRLSENLHFLDSLRNAVSRSSSAKSTGSHNSRTSSGGTSNNSTAFTAPSEASVAGKEAPTTATTHLSPSSASQGRHVQRSATGPVVVLDPDLEQGGESQYDARKEWESEVEGRQKLITFSEKITWVHHGKEEFEKLVDRLFQMNQMLRDMLPRLEIPEPFEKIRNGRERPYLWVKSAEVRKALENLNVTLRRVNRAEGTRNLKITVRLEEDHDETRNLLEQGAPFFTRLPLRHNSLAFRLATYFEQSSEPNEISQIEALICTSISKLSDAEFDSLPRKLQAIKNNVVENDEQFAEVGQLIPDIQNAWSVYREVTLADSAWLSEKTVEDFVDHKNFTPKQRIYLAAKVAIAHLHFAAVNRGFACRQLRSYRYFRQAADRPYDWTIPFVSNPWLDYGFGSPVMNTGRIRLNAPAQEAPAKIDPAIELGILLYQITSSTKMQYNNVAELKVAGEEAARSLNKVLGICGLPVMEIVETCFEPCPSDDRISGGQDAAFVVIEEVAAALMHQAKQFKEQG
jgi:hypothetical protein